MGNPSNDHLIVLPLSRFANMSPNLVATLQLNPIAIAARTTDPPLDQQVIDAQEDAFTYLHTLITLHHLTIDSQNCFRKDTTLVVVENNDLKRGVLHTFHTLHTAGHLGITNTIALIQPYYWWPDMKTFVTNYIRGCATCQMNKINTNPAKPPLFPITPISTLPFQTVTMDFITKLPPSEGYDTILTIMDHDVSKACILLPCKETIDAVGVAALYATHMFPHYGIPLKIVSNRDPQFNSTFTTHLCHLPGIKQNISTAYHPQMDGQSERTNQSLETYLQLYYDSQQREWSKLLPLVQYVRNSWPNATTRQVPFNTLIGYTPTAHQPTRTTDLPTLQECLIKINESRSAAQEAMLWLQGRSDKGPSHFEEYQIGDKVWLEGTNLKCIEGTPKLSPRQYRPFRVATKISHVTYKLELPDHWRIHNVFHASLLTPY